MLSKQIADADGDVVAGLHDRAEVRTDTVTTAGEIEIGEVGSGRNPEGLKRETRSAGQRYGSEIDTASEFQADATDVDSTSDRDTVRQAKRGGRLDVDGTEAAEVAKKASFG